VKKIFKGVVNGNVIRLEESLDLPLGSRAIITLTTLKKDVQAEITDRQMKLLKKGFNLGKKLYTRRNELYGR